MKLSEVFIKWLQGTNCKTFDELMQLLLLEKFYASIPKELVALLKDKQIKTLVEAAKIADECDAYRDKIFSSQKMTNEKYHHFQKNNQFATNENFRNSRSDNFRF